MALTRLPGYYQEKVKVVSIVVTAACLLLILLSQLQDRWDGSSGPCTTTVPLENASNGVELSVGGSITYSKIDCPTSDPDCSCMFLCGSCTTAEAAGYDSMEARGPEPCGFQLE